MIPEGWKLSTIEEISKVASGGTPSRKNQDYWGGSIPWVTTAEVKFGVIFDSSEKITELGLNNSSAKIFPIDTILMAMYGQGKTRGQVAKLGIEATTNQACAAIMLREEYDVDFYFQFLMSRYEHIRDMSNSGGQENLSAGIVKSIQVTVPPLLEQREISKVLSVWDKAIATTEKLLANSQKNKKGLMQQLLTGKKRLPKFDGGWKEIRLKDVLTEEKERNKDNSFDRVLSVTNHSGFVLPEDQFSKRIASDNVTNYKVVRKGQFGYNPSRINVGSFARLDDYDVGLLSPMYVIFSIKTEILDSGYFLTWMSSNEAKQRIGSSTQGSVRNSVGFDALCSIPIKLPSLEEQQHISSLFCICDEEIKLLQERLNFFNQEKQALLQQLLTGKRRVKLH